jgi:hypothetical protein
MDARVDVRFCRFLFAVVAFTVISDPPSQKD